MTARYLDTSGWYSNYRVGETTAATKIIIDRGTDTIVGAHLLGPEYGEVVNLFALAIKRGRTTRQLKSTPSRNWSTRSKRPAGPTGLLFPSRSGSIVRRSNFQQIWIRAADKAGWPMTSPLKKTAGSGEKNKGWKWTGAAKWTPHDLRHVAACWMLFDLGLEPPVVAEFLGHSDPSFTVRRYVGIRGNPEQAATPRHRRLLVGLSDPLCNRA